MTPTTQLDLGLILPKIGPDDRCIDQLLTRLASVKGIQEAHVVRTDGDAQLCLHYDPELLPLSRVRRMAEETGMDISDRYRHEQLPLTGLDSADNAQNIAEVIAKLPGILHTNANYATGVLAVAYDSTITQRSVIEQRMRTMGVRVPQTVPASADRDHAAESAQHDAHAGHGHGSAPAFLPHWLQEYWTLVLVGIAGIAVLLGWVGESYFALSASVAIGLYLLAYVAGGYDIATHAVPGLLRGKFDTDVLMLAAAVGAAILGEWREGAFLLFLFALGHAGEHYALGRARNAVNALGALMPKTAQVRRGAEVVELDVAQVQIDDLVVVRPGDRVAVDGIIAQGQSAIDQSSVTGESVPVTKQPGDQVFAGTINQDAALDVRVTKLARDNTLSRIMQMVAEAQSQQSPTQQFTQRFTRWFVPAVLMVVVLVIVLPPLIGWMPLRESFYRAMLLLVAASPCALALGTPAAVLTGIAQAARNGVLIKGGVHLENLGSLRVMAFDKTGTLTEGRFSVTDLKPLAGHDEQKLLRIAAAVEQQSNHPLAQAVLRAARERGLELPVATGLENVPGRGVRSQVDNQIIRIGSLALLTEDNLPISAEVEPIITQLSASGRSSMVVSAGEQVIGVLGLADTLRANASSTMAQLLHLGMQHLVILTGDNQTVAQRIAGEVGLTDIRADLLPEDKLRAIQALQQQYGSIAMIGDGVNDAPALASATVGIAMGGAGTAVALETADVALMGDDLSKLPFAVGLSRASRAIIRQNLAIALGVIGLLLVTSVFGLVQLSGAVVLHEGSTIVVVLNALRLLRYRLPGA
jgi:Cd2+/Zn2+-exporting ATPase